MTKVLKIKDQKYLFTFSKLIVKLLKLKTVGPIRNILKLQGAKIKFTG